MLRQRGFVRTSIVTALERLSNPSANTPFFITWKNRGIKPISFFRQQSVHFVLTTSLAQHYQVMNHVLYGFSSDTAKNNGSKSVPLRKSRSLDQSGNSYYHPKSSGGRWFQKPVSSYAFSIKIASKNRMSSWFMEKVKNAVKNALALKDVKRCPAKVLARPHGLMNLIAFLIRDKVS